MRQAGEPSVEEILDSIKKVIARDSRTPAVEERRVHQLRPVRDPAEDEVLDLTEAAALDPEVAAPTDAAEDGPLLADAAVDAMRDSLAALATMAAPGAAPQIVRAGETSLEGLVREMLRPLLADWLDKNLPPLVERMVAAEIARIVGKKG
ncbi:DUF2497 domain-containing protein [Novosphingobium piscinae]|uniref:DUF2497 domain-containing protein n=1 Tax=Novosphingobium piscinae TaxID=1507448 RepID=A0A7X1G229_9SPHN|nr:DUF2497 domain-containing protein [Novosphingobium piscinae]MBC2670537.1 DUF2497 domain-containing protein [Novosphingobium piscinae]